jgi:MFS family permease
MISVVAMGTSTFAIGIMPTDARIGASAALCLVLLRIIAGLSVGGEFTGAIILLGEHAPPPRRAYYAIWPAVGCLVGFLLGSGIGGLDGDRGLRSSADAVRPRPARCSAGSACWPGDGACRSSSAV